MESVDPTARVAAGAVIGRDVSIGPYCVVGPHVTLGDGCRLVAHVHIAGHTTIGPRTSIAPFASLGTPPQSTRYRGGPTRLLVGADCDIRESVTINIGTEDDRGVTEVGDHCFMMAGSHVGHDCKVGSHVTFANNAVLGGHVTIGDHVFLGGQAAVHQFVRIGESAMVGGLTGVTGDVIPFGFVFGPRASLVGLNVVGLRRRGTNRDEIHRLRAAYKILFEGADLFQERVARVAAEFDNDLLVGKVIDFIRSVGKRPLIGTGGASADEEPA